jgi:two-component system, cell cycle response regulator
VNDDDEIAGESTQYVRMPAATPAVQANVRRPYLVLAGTDGRSSAFWPLDATKIIGRDPSADIRIELEGVSRRHVRIVVDGHRLVAQDLESRNGLFLNGERIQTVTLAEGDALQLGGALLRLVFRDSVDDAAFTALQESARRDALTGAYNRRYLDERLEGEFAYARRHRTLISVILIDVDHFKRVNDTFGHLAGDAVLRELAGHMLRQVRVEDVLARYGGEELVVICRDTDGNRAAVLAERIRETVAELPIVYQGQAISVTISGGVTSGPVGADAGPHALIQRADEALYAAKRGGRNRIVVG